MKKKWYLVHLAVTILLIFGLRAWSGKRPASAPKPEAKKSAPAAPPAALPVSKPVKSADPLSPERLVETGELVIFGPSTPRFDQNRGVQVGKGQCPACHVLIEEQRPNRFPRLVGVVARAGERIHEERYKKFAKRYEAGEPSTGIKPHAKTAGEYLIESIYCPSCYVVEGINIGETEEMVSPMPVINGAGFGVNDYEMVAIVSYLQAADAKGDLSKVTARQDWENYFGKKLTVGTGGMEQASAASPQDLSRVGLAQEKPEEIIQKMGCYLCHTIPTVAIAQTGKIGPLLALKTIAAQRIASPEYQRAVKEGKARAKTPKDYVIESILYPSVFITPGFDDAMPKDFKQKMTLGATERLAEFLITLEEEPPKKEGSPSSPAEAKRPPKSKG